MIIDVVEWQVQPRLSAGKMLEDPPGPLGEGMTIARNHGVGILPPQRVAQLDVGTAQGHGADAASGRRNQQPADRRGDRGECDRHIDGAAHTHAGLLSDRLGEFPKDRPIVVTCGSGYRASIAASLLRRHGYRDVTHLVGGMTAWNAAGLPTVAAT